MARKKNEDGDAIQESEDDLAERVHEFSSAVDASYVAPDVTAPPSPEVLAEAERIRIAEKVRAQHNEHGRPRLVGE